jgi:hypothetical protein
LAVIDPLISPEKVSAIVGLFDGEIRMAEKEGAHGENAEDPETSESNPPERRNDFNLKDTISCLTFIIQSIDTFYC